VTAQQRQDFTIVRLDSAAREIATSVYAGDLHCTWVAWARCPKRPAFEGGYVHLRPTGGEWTQFSRLVCPEHAQWFADEYGIAWDGVGNLRHGSPSN
jgi:hypothetical protein